MQDEEEEGGDEEQPESAERKEHDRDGQTGEENVQSETAVELGGEASERDQAKEVHFTLTLNCIKSFTCLRRVTLENPNQ